MKLQSFRIKHFRSIKDTDWQNFSKDNIIALIGQNEAGKTTILEALKSFSDGIILPDYLRSDGTWPEVSCSFDITSSEIEELFVDQTLPRGLVSLISQKKRINLKRSWTDYVSDKLTLEEEELSSLFKQTDVNNQDQAPQIETTAEQPAQTEVNNQDQAPQIETTAEQPAQTEVNNQDQAPQIETTAEQPAQTEVNNQDQAPRIETTEDQFIDAITDIIPVFESFEDFASLLPDSIDISDLQNKNTKAEGYIGVRNFLTIAGLDINFFQNQNLRFIENHIDKRNKSITADFHEFWTQKVGKSNKISIKFDLQHHDVNNSEKAGKPYLVFWICDGEEKLYPKQRSKGVRWFTSFYLQLKAISLENNKQGTVFLIDEPGGSLHQRAQEDVLKVFEEIKDKVQIIYTTHSPHLIKLETIHRLLAVQRANEEDDKSETHVFNAHKLGAASLDTLSPIITLMGADLSNQQIIKKKNNIILEEISAFYYLSAFLKITVSQKEMHFIPATGVNKIPVLVNLFLGWGLEFRVVIDDGGQGRGVYNKLKRDLYQDDDNQAKKHILKIRDCNGIEDIFSKDDFKKYVLENEKLSIKQKNSEYMKGKAKAVFALKFMQKVKKTSIKIDQFDEETKNNIKTLIENIESLL